MFEQFHQQSFHWAFCSAFSREIITLKLRKKELQLNLSTFCEIKRHRMFLKIIAFYHFPTRKDEIYQERKNMVPLKKKLKYCVF
jgi:hypothetical protein